MPAKRSPLPFDQPVMTEDLTNVIGSRAEDDHHRHPRAAGPICRGPSFTGSSSSGLARCGFLMDSRSPSLDRCQRRSSLPTRVWAWRTSTSGPADAVYVAGGCLGALVFGQLTDRFGRKKLFLITLAVHTIATVLTAFSPSPLWYFACRFLTGAGIGGEYAAINSAIDELIPAHYRGRVDIVINGSFWIGAVGGALLTIPLLDPTKVDPSIGWRVAFGLGAILALGVFIVRRHVPESPRWLFIHGREDEGDRIVTEIEEQVRAEDGELPEPSGTITVRQRRSIGMALIARSVFTLYPRRTVLCFALFIGQAFLYNAFFFTYGDTLTTFLDV
jgi:MFS family permease